MSKYIGYGRKRNAYECQVGRVGFYLCLFFLHLYWCDRDGNISKSKYVEFPKWWKKRWQKKPPFLPYDSSHCVSSKQKEGSL